VKAQPGIVLFDLGGVLLPFDQAKRVRAVAEALRVTEFAASAAMTPELFARLGDGRRDEAEFAAAFTDLAGRHVTAAEAKDLIISVFEAPNAPLWAFAATLARRITVGAFSDNPAFVSEAFPAGARLAPLFWSSEIGALKPSAAFDWVEASVGVAPERIIFVDDTLANVDAARARGWDAILFRSNDDVIAEFAQRGLP